MYILLHDKKKQTGKGERKAQGSDMCKEVFLVWQECGTTKVVEYQIPIENFAKLFGC